MLIFLISFIFWSVIVGLLANRKGRDPVLWGIFGGFSWFFALIILAFVPKIENSVQPSKSSDDSDGSEDSGNPNSSSLA